MLAKPPTVTTTAAVPAVMLFGTKTTILAALQLIGVATVPPIITVLAPCVVPNPLPVIVTEIPPGPDAGLRPEMLGITAKSAPLLATPPTVTTTLPVAAPFGTPTVITPVDHEVGVAGVPLNVIVLVPCRLLNPSPTMVTDVPAAPEDGLKLEMLGSTVNRTPLLAAPPTVTITLPAVAPLGTGTKIEAALQLMGVAKVPLKATVLVPRVAPKLPPAIVTLAPTWPVVGLRLVMVGAGVIEKLT